MDIYISCPDGPTITTFFQTAPFSYTIGPKQGTAAADSYVDANGNTIPAQPAKGDPSLFYGMVRFGLDVTPLITAQEEAANAAGTPALSVVDFATGDSVCGGIM